MLARERPAPLHQPKRGATRGRGSHRKRLLGALLRQVFAVQQELNHLRRHSRQQVLRCAHGRRRSPRRTSRMLCLVAAAATTAAGVRPARGRGDDATRPCVARSVHSWLAASCSVASCTVPRRTRAGRRDAAPPCRTAQRSSIRGSVMPSIYEHGAGVALIGRPARHRSGQGCDLNRERTTTGTNSYDATGSSRLVVRAQRTRAVRCTAEYRGIVPHATAPHCRACSPAGYGRLVRCQRRGVERRRAGLRELQSSARRACLQRLVSNAPGRFQGLVVLLWQGASCNAPRQERAAEANAAQVHARTNQGGSPAEASARQEPPPKCLVLYAEGVAAAVERGRVRFVERHPLLTSDLTSNAGRARSAARGGTRRLLRLCGAQGTGASRCRRRCGALHLAAAAPARRRYSARALHKGLEARFGRSRAFHAGI